MTKINQDTILEFEELPGRYFRLCSISTDHTIGDWYIGERIVLNLQYECIGKPKNKEKKRPIRYIGR